jgi:lactoylglutathione lyase
MKTLLTGYRVSDLQRSERFYRAVGFREIGRAPLGDGTILVMLNLPGDGDVVTLELEYAPAAGALVVGNGFRHIAVQVDDLAATVTELTRNGITCGPIEHPGGTNGPIVSNLRDPDGYQIELVQWPPGHADGMTSEDFR